MKGAVEIATLDPRALGDCVGICGGVLARAGAAAPIAGCLGRGDATDRATVRFAGTFGAPDKRDHARLVAAIAGGVLDAAPRTKGFRGYSSAGTSVGRGMTRSLARAWPSPRPVPGFPRRAVSMVSPPTVGLLVPLDRAGHLSGTPAPAVAAEGADNTGEGRVRSKSVPMAIVLGIRRTGAPLPGG